MTIIFSRNVVDLAQIGFDDATTGFENENLQDYRLSKVFRTTELEPSIDIHLNDTMPINFVALVDSNLSLTGTWAFSLQGPYLVSDPHFLNQHAWTSQPTEGTFTFLGAPAGGVRLDGSGNFKVNSGFVTGAGYYNPMELKLSTDYNVIVKTTKHSASGIMSMNFGTTLLFNGTPNTYKNLQGGTNTFTIRAEASETQPVPIDLLKFSPNATMDMTIHSVYISEATAAHTEPAAAPIDRYYPLGANPWESAVGAGKVPLWVREKSPLIAFKKIDPVNASRVTIDLADTDNPYGFIQIGRIVVGYAVQPGIGVDYSWHESHKDLSKKKRLPLSGEVSINEGATVRKIRVAVPHLTELESFEWEVAFAELGQSKDCLIVPFPDNDSHQSRKAIYGILFGDHGVKSSHYDDFRADINVESVGGSRYGLI